MCLGHPQAAWAGGKERMDSPWAVSPTPPSAALSFLLLCCLLPTRHPALPCETSQVPPPSGCAHREVSAVEAPPKLEHRLMLASVGSLISMPSFPQVQPVVDRTTHSTLTGPTPLHSSLKYRSGSIDLAQDLALKWVPEDTELAQGSRFAYLSVPEAWPTSPRG